MDNTTLPTLSTASTEAAIKDLVTDVALAKQAIAAVKTGGVAALAPLAPQIAAAVEKGVTEIQAAIPEIKAGYKSTEFWATVGAVAGGAVYVLVTGKDIPVNLAACAASIIAIYTVARTLFKAKAVAPVATPAK